MVRPGVAPWVAVHSTLRRVSFIVLSLATFVALAQPASAGGSPLYPVRDRYEPGDLVTFVGYTGGGQLGWLEDGPFYGYLLRPAGNTGSHEPGDSALPLGEMSITETGHGGWLAVRASISFTLPVDMAPGTYYFDYCSAGCVERLGDLTTGSIRVGVGPPNSGPITRQSPLDEPEIANLAPDTVVSGSGFDVLAGQVQAGKVEIDERTGLPSLDPATPSTSPPLTAAPITAPGSTSPPASPEPTTTLPIVDAEPEVEAAALVTTSAGGTRDGSSAALPWVMAALLGVVAVGLLGGAMVTRRRRPAGLLDGEAARPRDQQP